MGIHLCKSLSSACIGMFNTLGPTKAPFLVLAPCCLPRLGNRNLTVRVYEDHGVGVWGCVGVAMQLHSASLRRSRCGCGYVGVCVGVWGCSTHTHIHTYSHVHTRACTHAGARKARKQATLRRELATRRRDEKVCSWCVMCSVFCVVCVCVRAC